MCTLMNTSPNICKCLLATRTICAGHFLTSAADFHLIKTTKPCFQVCIKLNGFHTANSPSAYIWMLIHFSETTRKSIRLPSAAYPRCPKQSLTFNINSDWIVNSRKCPEALSATSGLGKSNYYPKYINLNVCIYYRWLWIAPWLFWN